MGIIEAIGSSPFISRFGSVVSSIKCVEARFGHLSKQVGYGRVGLDFTRSSTNIKKVQYHHLNQ